MFSSVAVTFGVGGGQLYIKVGKRSKLCLEVLLNCDEIGHKGIELFDLLHQVILLSRKLLKDRNTSAGRNAR